MASRFQDLVCWQLSNELKVAVYAFLAAPAASRDRDFCEDIKRAARSAPANIAEGFGRHTHREFAHFLSIARASLFETESHLLHAYETRCLSHDEWTRLVDLAQQAQKATAGLRRYLLATREQPSQPRRVTRQRGK